jgi:hypothetical protein
MIAGEIWLTSDDIPELTTEIGVVLRVSMSPETSRNNIRSVRVVPRDRLLFYDAQEFKRNECKANGWLTISYHIRYAICFGIICDRGMPQPYRDVSQIISNHEYRTVLSDAIRTWVIGGIGTAPQTYENQTDHDKEGKGGIFPASQPQTQPRADFTISRETVLSAGTDGPGGMFRGMADYYGHCVALCDFLLSHLASTTDDRPYSRVKERRMNRERKAARRSGNDA